jgi:hypothetical protein
MKETITTQIKSITTPSTEDWGNAMKDFVKSFTPIAAIIVTVYVYSRDAIRRPSMLIDFLLSKGEVSSEISLPNPTKTEVPVSSEPVITIPLTAPVDAQVAVRRRTTRKRGLSEIRSLTA